MWLQGWLLRQQPFSPCVCRYIFSSCQLAINGVSHALLRVSTAWRANPTTKGLSAVLRVLAMPTTTTIMLRLSAKDALSRVVHVQMLLISRAWAATPWTNDNWLAAHASARLGTTTTQLQCVAPVTPHAKHVRVALHQIAYLALLVKLGFCRAPRAVAKSEPSSRCHHKPTVKYVTIAVCPVTAPRRTIALPVQLTMPGQEMLEHVLVILGTMMMARPAPAEVLRWHWLIACDPYCLTCNGITSKDCVTCNSADSRVLTGTECLCDVGFKDIGVKKCNCTTHPLRARMRYHLRNVHHSWCWPMSHVPEHSYQQWKHLHMFFRLHRKGQSRMRW
jgi:hypothetical protein